MTAEYWTPPALAFADRRWNDRTSPVTDESGQVVATILPSTFSSRFDASDATGAPLCSGRKVFFDGWVGVDPAGDRLVQLQPGFLSARQSVFRGGALTATVRGRLFSRSWRLEAPDGRALLESVQDTSGWNLFRDAWVVRSDGTLALAEIIATVELHRLDVKRRRSSSSTSASAS